MSRWPWPAPMADGAADHLVRGTRLPNVTLPSTAGTLVNLAALAARTAIFIYPWTGRPGHPQPPDWDDIPGAHGSTPELQSVAGLYTGFSGIGAEVVAVSGQDTDWQADFAGRNKLPFPILSDADGALRDALKLPVFATGGVTYLKRLTLVVSKGVIERAFYPVHPPDVHPREILAWMSATASYAAEARLKSAPK